MAVRSEDVAAEAVGRRMTLDEFLALPGTKPALEYDGEMVSQKPALQGQAAHLLTYLSSEVNDFAKGRKIALALSRLRTTYAGCSYVPDLAVYLWNRIPREVNGYIADWFTEPPDVAVEIVGPNKSDTTPFEKSIWYVNSGVKIALVVDPDQDVVFRFRPDALPDALRGDDRIDLDEVLPGFDLTVAQLFESLLQD